MATNQTPPQSLEQSLELRLLNFEVHGDRNTFEFLGSNPHDEVQRLLEANERWGDQFRYGSAASSFSTDMELMSQGKAASQPNASDGSLKLYRTGDSRDRYCNSGFFEGREIIVVYDQRMLKPTGPNSYQLLDTTGLVAIVRPVFTHPDS